MDFTPDHIIKLIFIVGLTISIVGMSFRMMRILGKVVDMMTDLRPAIKNVSDLTTQFVEDYKLAGEAIRGVSSSVININDNFIKPISNISKLMGKFMGKGEEK